MEAKIYDQKGAEKGTIALPEAVFGVPWNADLVYQVVNAMRSSARAGTANTKTRGEVRGGGKKPWQQKGLGRARHGSTRSPIWVGGGITHGPRADKDYGRKINKKAKAKALAVVLSKKFRDGEVMFLDAVSMTAPKTKEAKAVLLDLAKIKGFEKLATKPKNAAVIAMAERGENAALGFRNFGNVSIEEYRNLNPLMALNSKYLIVAGAKEIFKEVKSGKAQEKLKTQNSKLKIEELEKHASMPREEMPSLMTEGLSERGGARGSRDASPAATAVPRAQGRISSKGLGKGDQKTKKPATKK